MSFLTVLLAMALGSESVAENSARVVLTREPSHVETDVLKPGSFALDFHKAFVAQGSYSGISVAFSTNDPSISHHKLTLFIPSHKGFSVNYSSAEGEFSLVAPNTGFTIHAEQTEGIFDRFHRPRTMTVSLAHWLQIGKHHWSENSMAFTNCRVDVDVMLIKDRALTISGQFECLSEESAYSAAGAFSVKGGELGVSKVD